MVFVLARDEPTIILMLTEQDCLSMRGGRTKFVDKTATKGKLFDQVVVSLHKDQAEIEEALRGAGHGSLLEGMPSPTPGPLDVTCIGCGGIMKSPQILDGRCIACWRELALDTGR